MDVLKFARTRKLVSPKAVCVVVATLCLSACQGPLDRASTTASDAPAALTVAFSVPSSRTVTASSDNFAAAIATLAVAIVDGSGTTVAQASGIAYGAGVVKTFGTVLPGSYTVSVNAYDAANVLIATGSSPVSVAASSNQNITVNLTFRQTASSGDFSLTISWPVSTGLSYVYAKVDNVDIAVPTVSSNGGNYTTSLSSSDLSGGSHLLFVYFKTSAVAQTIVGPFVETVNIWDGVNSTYWIDTGGNPVRERSFAATDFSSSNADLAGLTFNGATLSGSFAAGTTGYTLTAMTGPTFNFSAVTINGSQDVAYTWNGVAQTWAGIGATAFNAQSLTWIAGTNTLQIIVTAPDRYTKKNYTVTATIANSTGVIVNIPTSYQALTFADPAPSIVQNTGVTFQTSNPTLAAVPNGWTWYIDGVAQSETSSVLSLGTGTTGAMLGCYFITARVTYGGQTYSGGFTLTVRRLP